MSHTGEEQEPTIDIEGTSYTRPYNLRALTIINMAQVQCNVGDWVEVTCDYSPGVSFPNASAATFLSPG